MRILLRIRPVLGLVHRMPRSHCYAVSTSTVSSVPMNDPGRGDGRMGRYRDQSIHSPYIFARGLVMRVNMHVTSARAGCKSHGTSGRP